MDDVLGDVFATFPGFTGGYSGSWDGAITADTSSSTSALDKFNSVVDSGVNLLSAVGRLQSAASNQSTAQYVARANADATRAAAQAQVQSAQKPFNSNTLMIWLAVAGLVFAAMQVMGKK